MDRGHTKPPSVNHAMYHQILVIINQYDLLSNRENYELMAHESMAGHSGVPRGGGGWDVQTPPPKFRSFEKAEPNSQFRGKYIRNNLTRIRLSLIF